MNARLSQDYTSIVEMYSECGVKVGTPPVFRLPGTLSGSRFVIYPDPHHTLISELSNQFIRTPCMCYLVDHTSVNLEQPPCFLIRPGIPESRISKLGDNPNHAYSGFSSDVRRQGIVDGSVWAILSLLSMAHSDTMAYLLNGSKHTRFKPHTLLETTPST